MGEILNMNLRREWHLFQFISLSVALLFHRAQSQTFWREIQKKLKNWVWEHEIKKKSFSGRPIKIFVKGQFFWVGQVTANRNFFIIGPSYCSIIYILNPYPSNINYNRQRTALKLKTKILTYFHLNSHIWGWDHYHEHLHHSWHTDPEKWYNKSCVLCWRFTAKSTMRSCRDGHLATKVCRF